jgi:hypothetical protein
MPWDALLDDWGFSANRPPLKVSRQGSRFVLPAEATRGRPAADNQSRNR